MNNEALFSCRNFLPCFFFYQSMNRRCKLSAIMEPVIGARAVTTNNLIVLLVPYLLYLTFTITIQ